MRQLKYGKGRGRSTATLVSLAAAVLAMVWIVGTPAPAQANLVTNGSFEEGTNKPTSNFTTLSAGNTDITGWTVTSGSVDWIRTYWTAQQGSYSLDLSGNSAGTIAATSFATTSGNWYEVDFWMSANPDSGLGQKDLQVAVSGIPSTENFSYTVTSANSLTNMLWALKSMNFQAQSSSTTLSFISLTNSAWGPALDNVSVEELYGGGAGIPEPVTMAGLVLGLGGLARYVRRRQRA